MEAHHPGMPHGKHKKFKDYLLEGLMIFLAVFLGFIAENLREHLSDSSKEKNYLNSLYIDLKQDSAKLADVMTAGATIQKGQDSLLNQLAMVSAKRSNVDTVYHLFFKYATSIPIFSSADRTLNQLTNSGNFRLIGNQSLADSVSNYYDKVKDISLQSTINNDAALDCVQFAQNIFKLDYALHPKQANKTLISYNAALIEKYRNKLIEMKISQQYYMQAELKDLNKNCLQLLAMLRKR
ncbi:hypothetical protein [Mucilaginibacter ginkgonis]|uniref:Uncharacterized protein n=1 Tax=Mucilaginibacter ginkgonis TaxID=2682091 RepID=A0A6I4HZC2_9SPHI|nr:hypothetical protein [Mucilaginibacter ginkgonis]QQL49452.1 hypothetical protein GO620_014950 [Mucilaginibacter ginkgonis]